MEGPCFGLKPPPSDRQTHNQTKPNTDKAVAVVVSLRDARKRVGVFRLTEPDGMQLIQQCVENNLIGRH